MLAEEVPRQEGSRIKRLLLALAAATTILVATVAPAMAITKDYVVDTSTPSWA
jgi:hypothetical protein